MGNKGLIAISVGAAGAGAAMMYLFDPKRGKRRRAYVGEKAGHAAREAGREVERNTRDLSNRLRGAAVETSKRLTQNDAPDEVLAEKVRSKLGRVLSHPRAIDVSAERGVVDLRGAVPRSERGRAIRTAESVRGVRIVRHDALRTYSDEEAISGVRREVEQPEWRRPRSGAIRALRVGIAIMSGIVGTYRAVQNNRRASQRQRTGETSSVPVSTWQSAPEGSEIRSAETTA
jgi:gas vesicle protein